MSKLEIFLLNPSKVPVNSEDLPNDPRERFPFK
jgi:hypothetical protein